MTAAQKRMAWFGGPYIVLALVVCALHALGVVDLNAHLSWPAGITIAVLLPLVAHLLGRSEVCPSCGSNEVSGTGAGNAG